MLDAIGVYGGTFDPIHFGHLNLAVQLMEFHGLKEVWFCPAKINPFKVDKQTVAIGHRLEMVSLAISSVPQFKLLDFEAKLEGPSYTVNTLRFLFEREQNSPQPRQLHLLLGDDSLEAFLKWKEPAEIVRLAPPLIGCRQWNQIREENDPISKAIRIGMTPTNMMEISSTDIRIRLAKGLYCGHLVPEKVLDYINKHQLYL
ncbi:MAG: nicotinate (nicotinamide) nucleotide adenylyltransferase [Parachlamydia sp.]|nr:MAG: nicotinate (nicotinamide) nucleotide adenylyltransferase [Parachlamydia sp.]